MIALAIPFGLLIGLVVGTVGGGGAILALPILVYILDEGVGQASTASLIVVALAAGLGSSALARDGQICWRIALSFSAPAAPGSVLGTLGSAAVSARVLILAFVPIMLLAAAVTWRRAASQTGDDRDDCPHARLSTVVLAGAGVGLLTGFFGVGGGFLIVPALTISLGVPVRRAIATSLVIITLTAIVALASHVAAGAELDVPVTVALASATGVGAVAGTQLGRQLPQAFLGRAFAIVVAAIAAFLLVDVLVLGGPPTR